MMKVRRDGTCRTPKGLYSGSERMLVLACQPRQTVSCGTRGVVLNSAIELTPFVRRCRGSGELISETSVFVCAFAFAVCAEASTIHRQEQSNTIELFRQVPPNTSRICDVEPVKCQRWLWPEFLQWRVPTKDLISAQSRVQRSKHATARMFRSKHSEGCMC